MTVGEKIKHRRLELGLSVSDLATKVGVHRATMYRYESSYIENLPINILEPIAVALLVTPGYFFNLGEGSVVLDELSMAKKNAIMEINNLGENKI